MRTPQEIFEIQKSFIDRSKNTLSTIKDEKLVAWNTTKLLNSTLVAWLMATRNNFKFHIGEIEQSKETLESNLEIILKQPGVTLTEYLFACMLTKSEPLSLAIEFAKTNANDINFLINSSVVPYVWFGLTSNAQTTLQLETKNDRKRNLSIKSSLAYLKLLSQDGEPSVSELSYLQELYRKRKTNSFYTESRLYGGGVDNDLVCDIEFAAIAICKGFSDHVL